MIRTGRMLLVVTAIAAGAATLAHAPTAAAQSANESAAQIRFQRGRDLFVARNFEGALTEFRAAVALVSSPNTRLYIARCLHNLNRNAEALLEYQRAAAEAADRAASEPRYAATRDTARSEAAQLEPLLGRLVVHVPNPPPGIAVRTGGNELPSGLFDVPAPSDPHAIEVVATAPGYLPFRTTANVATGATAEVTIQLRPDPAALAASHAPQSSGAPVATRRMVTVRQGGGVRYAGIAVAAVGLVGGGVVFGLFGTMATTRYNELQAQCPAGCPEREAFIAEGERNQLIADIALGAGAALVVIGGVMAIAGGPREVQVARDHAQRESSVRWTVWGGPASGTGGIGGVAATF